MWQCVNCRERVSDDFDVCWSCGTSSDGVADPGFQHAEQVPPEDMKSPVIPPPPSTIPDVRTRSEEARAKIPLSCPRCYRDMEFAGAKSFHEGFGWGLLGDWAELLVNHETFDLYVCRRCGRVEFFVSGIAERFRGRD